jgi:hypothetical protein
MNERIKELAEQAGAVFEKTNGLNDCPQDSLVGDEIQEFAELIVQECAAEADKCAERGSWMAGYRIKQHFGVEEPLSRLDTMQATNPITRQPSVLLDISEGVYPNRVGVNNG